MSENIYPKVSAFETSGYGVSASPKFPKLEEAVLDYWKKDGTFQASIDNREAGPHGDNEFVFYDGPPFANGLPHYGHLLTGYAKDHEYPSRSGVLLYARAEFGNVLQGLSRNL